MVDKILPYASPLLTVLGWGIAYQLAKFNSTRTESKSIMDSCNSLIDSLSEAGVSFYLDKPVEEFKKRSFEHFANIKVAALYKKIEILRDRGIEVSDELISDLHVALTNEIRLQGSQDHEVDKCVHAIIRNASDMSSHIQTLFHNKYPPFSGIKSFKNLF